MPRLRSSFTFLAIALLVAGCTSEGVQTASSESKASNANAMLESPPGSDVKPTGNAHDFTLYLHRMAHEVYPGATMGMWGFSLSDDPSTASVPGPILRVTEGDLVRVTLISTFAGFNHTLHFHGQDLPYEMDGVAYLSQDVVEPGDEFTYEFIAKPSGTYWYHCHVDAQHHMDMGMYGVLIVDPQEPADDPIYDPAAEFVMVLDDMDRFHIESGTTPTASLPQGGDYYSTRDFTERTANDVATRNSQGNDALAQGNTTVRPNRDWYPVTYAPYTATYNTWLINGFSFPYTEALVVKEGQTARIRLVNAGNSLMTMHLHGHHMLVTHKDGVLLDSPYWVDVIAIAPGERYDLYVPMVNPGLWEFHDHIGGHTQNDNIFPGGAMTMLCYEGISGCMASGGHDHGGRSGDLLRWSGRELP
jgi:FtsP/CotA-like multicopper oxidase with cupredoxin domain